MTVQCAAPPSGSSIAYYPEIAGLAAEPLSRAGQEPASMLSPPLRSYLELRAVPAAVPFARRHAGNVLQGWHMRPLAETVELLVSEIITNAVSASAGLTGQRVEPGQKTRTPPVRFWLSSDRNLVTIQVWDADHHQPKPQDAGLDTETGRGLLLVGALSTRWGCHAMGRQSGKIVWAVCA